MMDDPRIEFFNALQSGGVGPANPPALVADGLLHRHRIEGDKPGSLNGWHVLHLDNPASGAGGSWKAGHSVKWCSKRLSALTASERVEIARRITEDRKRAQEAAEARHKAAANRATWIWDNSKPASPSHPYLVRKMIKPGLSRQHNGDITLRLLNFTGETVGLQFIHADGSKRFLPGTKKKGAFTVVSGTPGNDGRIMIAEGFATASTIAELSPGAWTIAAMDAGNLEPVATECRRAFPLAEIVVCADADEIGMEKAKAAAIASRSKWIWPRFPKDAPAGLSDFNDWHTWRKSQGVAS
jgi:putative DNA primase/helicase